MVRRMKTPVGAINRLIDRYLHPLAEKDPTWWIIDGILHSTVEYWLRGQNTHRSIDKFLQYNLEPFLKTLTDKYKDNIDLLSAIDDIQRKFDIDIAGIVTHTVRELWKMIKY